MCLNVIASTKAGAALAHGMEQGATLIGALRGVFVWRAFKNAPKVTSILLVSLRRPGHEVVDFGARELDPADDYPDFVVPMAQAVASGALERGLALCGSGVGAPIAANKLHGVRAALIEDAFAARQGVEDDDMNVLSLGGKVIKPGPAIEPVTIFLASRFSGAKRHRRRIAKVMALETPSPDASAVAREHGP